MWSWWNDKALRTTVLVAGLLRVVPMLVWIDKPCVRDECTYMELADAILDGRGVVGTHGWLWAPAYSFLMAIHAAVTGYEGAVEVSQLVVAMASVVWLHRLTAGEYGDRAGRIAAWIYALNPTLIFYTSSLWSETFYGGLLLAAMLALRWARGGGAGRGWLPGLLLGLCVLFRGVATYMLPVFVVALLWHRWRARAAWGAVVACVLTAVLTVAPYSVYATRKWGELVIADRTLGQMMYLGNNDFAPITFDYGNGAIAERTYERAVATGREACERDGNPVRKDDCEAEAGKKWILEHPGAFLARIPLRVAQLVTPHSFLTRHLRWGRWHGLPQWFDEVLIVEVVGFSFLTLVGGTIGWFTRARGWFALTSGLIVLYHVAAIAVLAGLSRYRVPLEPLWLVHCGAVLAAPREMWARLWNGSLRSVVGVMVTVVLVALMLRFLPAGWPTWHTW
jgi:4-amino-4-deoxy-L-arabinose transferase-like glycosyltransferase